MAVINIAAVAVGLIKPAHIVMSAIAGGILGGFIAKASHNSYGSNFLFTFHCVTAGVFLFDVCSLAAVMYNTTVEIGTVIHKAANLITSLAEATSIATMTLAEAASVITITVAEIASITTMTILLGMGGILFFYGPDKLTDFFRYFQPPPTIDELINLKDKTKAIINSMNFGQDGKEGLWEIYKGSKDVKSINIQLNALRELFDQAWIECYAGEEHKEHEALSFLGDS
jgi:hypothetical protein